MASRAIAGDNHCPRAASVSTSARAAAMSSGVSPGWRTFTIARSALRATAASRSWSRPRELTAQRIVRYGFGQPAKAGLWAVALTVDTAQHDGACAGLLRWCQFDGGEPPRHPFPSVAGSEEIGITLEEREGGFDCLGLTAVETHAELDDP